MYIYIYDIMIAGVYRNKTVSAAIRRFIAFLLIVTGL